MGRILAWKCLHLKLVPGRQRLIDIDSNWWFQIFGFGSFSNALWQSLWLKINSALTLFAQNTIPDGFFFFFSILYMDKGTYGDGKSVSETELEQTTCSYWMSYAKGLTGLLWFYFPSHWKMLSVDLVAEAKIVVHTLQFPWPISCTIDISPP